LIILLEQSYNAFFQHGQFKKSSAFITYLLSRLPLQRESQIEKQITWQNK
jgi:hypothetical protein